jgi:hypothetical protein
LKKSISSHHLDDNALGKALDEIYAYGASKLFGEIAFEIALENNLLGSLAHRSFHLCFYAKNDMPLYD